MKKQNLSSSDLNGWCFKSPALSIELAVLRYPVSHNDGFGFLFQ